MAPEPEKEYTMEEVSKHNKTEDCWLVIGNDATGMLIIRVQFLLHRGFVWSQTRVLPVHARASCTRVPLGFILSI